MIGEDAAEGVAEEMEDDCRIFVGEDRPSRREDGLLLLLFEVEFGVVVGIVGCACFACSGGSIIVIGEVVVYEGGERESEWWRLANVFALDGKIECYG